MLLRTFTSGLTDMCVLAIDRLIHVTVYCVCLCWLLRTFTAGLTYVCACVGCHALLLLGWYNVCACVGCFALLLLGWHVCVLAIDWSAGSFPRWKPIGCWRTNGPAPISFAFPKHSPPHLRVINFRYALNLLLFVCLFVCLFAPISFAFPKYIPLHLRVIIQAACYLLFVTCYLIVCFCFVFLFVFASPSSNFRILLHIFSLSIYIYEPSLILSHVSPLLSSSLLRQWRLWIRVIVLSIACFITCRLSAWLSR